jgi:cytochrome P450
MIDQLNVVAENGIAISMDEYFNKLTIEVICDVAFQLDIHSLDNYETQYNEIHKSINDIFELKHVQLFPGFKWLMKLSMFFNYLSILLPYASFFKFRKAKQTLKKFSRIVLNHIKNLNSNNNLRSEIASSLIEFSSLPNVTEEDVLTEIATILIGGAETTSNTLNFIIYGLVVNQEVQSRCQSEINEWTLEKQSLYRNQEESEIIIKGDNSNTGSNEKNESKDMDFESQISDFILPPYVEGCIKESMRKWPVGVLILTLIYIYIYIYKIYGIYFNITFLFSIIVNQSVRKVNEEQGFSIDTLGKHVTIPKDSWLLVNFFALHNNSKIWNEEPTKFDPTRWLDLDVRIL